MTLPATTEPPYPEERLVVREVRGPRGAGGSLSAWACACGLTERGAGDGGGRVWLARCAPPMDTALLFSAPDGSVDRVIAFDGAD